MAILFALWLLEWIFAWSSHLGALEDAIDLLWFVGLIVFVVSTRSGRVPRALHTWGWMVAVLAIVAVRACWIGGEGLLLITDLLRQATSERPFAGIREFQAIDAVATSMVVGLLVGFVGACEAGVIVVATWIGDRLRADRPAPRVSLLPRLTVALLQVPIFLGLLAVGLSALAGALGTLAHPSADERVTGSIVMIIGVGVSAWAVAVVHIRRLEAFVRGGLVTRVLLAVFALFGAAVVIASGVSITSAVASAVWLGLQLGALRWARPAPAPVARA